MIQHLEKWLHSGADLGMIVNPSSFWIDVSFHRNLDLETMPVHAPAFMICRRIGQGLRRLKGKILS
jgi:hypothetical protein